MPYCTQDDLVAAVGEERLVLLADLDRDNFADTEVVLRAIADADATIDSYLSHRYPLPLSSTPPIVRQYAVDITLYRLSASHDVLTKETRERYDQACKWLQSVVENRASIGAAYEPTTTDGFAKRTGPDRQMKLAQTTKIF